MWPAAVLVAWTRTVSCYRVLFTTVLSVCSGSCLCSEPQTRIAETDPNFKGFTWIEVWPVLINLQELYVSIKTAAVRFLKQTFFPPFSTFETSTVLNGIHVCSPLLRRPLFSCYCLLILLIHVLAVSNATAFSVTLPLWFVQNSRTISAVIFCHPCIFLC